MYTCMPVTICAVRTTDRSVHVGYGTTYVDPAILHASISLAELAADRVLAFLLACKKVAGRAGKRPG